MKKGILIIHGPTSALKSSIMEDLHGFFTDYSYEIDVQDLSVIANRIDSSSGNFLIETIDPFNPGLDAVNVYIDCTTGPAIEDNGYNSLVFNTKGEERNCPIIAGSIIAKQITWCKANKVPVEF